MVFLFAPVRPAVPPTAPFSVERVGTKLPQRMIIIGCGGSGKSTLARQMAQITGIPLIHLDRYFWRPGWRPIETSHWEQIVDDLSSAPQWIMDGNYGGTMPRRVAACDTVVFLDMPTITCLWRVLKRRWIFAGTTRADMGAGCKERLTWEFVRYILTYRRTRKPRILALLAEHRVDTAVVWLRNQRMINQFLSQLSDQFAHPRNQT